MEKLKKELNSKEYKKNKELKKELNKEYLEHRGPVSLRSRPECRWVGLG